jgi:hypothetical protein
MEIEMRFKRGEPADCAALLGAMERRELGVLRRGWGRVTPENLAAAAQGARLCWTVFIDGEAACIFGVSDTDAPGVGSSWMVSSPAIRRAKVRFVRQSAKMVLEMFGHYDTLVCHAWGENKYLLGWLRWLGYEFEDLGNGFLRGRLEKNVFTGTGGGRRAV